MPRGYIVVDAVVCEIVILLDLEQTLTLRDQ